MRNSETAELWVVYKMTVWGKLAGPNAVCGQTEWEELERQRPGHHLLIRAGITNEPEAEKLARESPGGTAVQVIHRLKAR